MQETKAIDELVNPVACKISYKIMNKTKDIKIISLCRQNDGELAKLMTKSAWTFSRTIVVEKEPKKDQAHQATQKDQGRGKVKAPPKAHAGTATQARTQVKAKGETIDKGIGKAVQEGRKDNGHGSVHG